MKKGANFEEKRGADFMGKSQLTWSWEETDRTGDEIAEPKAFSTPFRQSPIRWMASSELEQREFRSELLAYDEGVEEDCTEQMLKKLSRQTREAMRLMRERQRASGEDREI